jgi:hypothetical protein
MTSQDRWERRKSQRFLDSLKHKAKKDMGVWLESLAEEPTIEMVQAWKAGYIAGINRMNNNKDIK